MFSEKNENRLLIVCIVLMAISMLCLQHQVQKALAKQAAQKQGAQK